MLLIQNLGIDWKLKESEWKVSEKDKDSTIV